RPASAGRGSWVYDALRASALEQVAQDVLHDAAVAVVARLTGGVYADLAVELDDLAIGLGRGDFDRPGDATLVELGDASEREGLRTGQAEGVGVLALGELQRDDAHADEVRAVDALVRLSDDGLDAEQRGALGGPVARRARAVLLAGQDDQRDAG